MSSSVDHDLFMATAKWCVYIHARPDGSPFYIGKGLRRRAYDFAPSRRTKHHRNIVRKHGRDNISVTVIPCSCEDEAFQIERAHIAGARSLGDRLANLTDGGEGCSGRQQTKAQKRAFEKGRGRGRHMPPESARRILDGLARGREKVKAWKTSPEGKAHLKLLAAIGPKALHRLRHQGCAQCGIVFETRSAKAKCCSRLCGQRLRRARRQHAN